MSVTRIRAPLQPIGWPRAMAPPYTLSLSGLTPRTLVTRALLTANASLFSNRSISSSFMPVFFRNLYVTGTGPRSITIGSVAATTMCRTTARGFNPNLLQASSDATSNAAAPSEIGDEFPAVPASHLT